MNQTIVNAIIIIAICLIGAAAVYLHKKHIQFSPESLETSIKGIFADNAAEEMPRQKFLDELKKKYSCTQKEANYLLGKARELKLVTVEDGMVRK